MRAEIGKTIYIEDQSLFIKSGFLFGLRRKAERQILNKTDRALYTANRVRR